MLISEKILYSMGAVIKNYIPSEFIFREGDTANYYYQIVKGEVKLNNYDEDGKEFIQNILSDGQGCGESILFINKSYPMNAEALTDCNILRLPKHAFLSLLSRFPKICFDLCNFLSNRLYYKFIMMQNVSKDPRARLIGLMDYLKSFYNNERLYSFQIPLTRQQMASLTGLRIETVIKTFKVMEKSGIVKIKDRKVFY